MLYLQHRPNTFTGAAGSNAVRLVDTLTTYTSNTVQSGDAFARLGAPAGASIAVDLVVIDNFVDGIESALGTPYDFGSGTSTIAANVQDLADDGTAVFDRSTDSMQAIKDRGDAAWTTGAGGSDRLLMVDTTIATLATQTSFTLTAGSADDDAYNNCSIIVEGVATATQKAVGMVLDYTYTGSTKTVILKEALAFTIAATDKVYILADNALQSTIPNRQLDATATGAAGIDWANIENPTTAVDLSGTDIQLVDTATTNTDMRGTDSAALASVATEARLAELDAANLPADVETVKTAVAAIQAITDLLTLAAINAEVDTAWITQMAVGKATVGQLPTREQALFEVRSLLPYFGISGTILTTHNPDASDGGTYTLDDATNPTSITPAT